MKDENFVIAACALLLLVLAILIYTGMGLDACLEGDATIYASEPIEHCSLQP